jgi:D-hydantoinase
MAKADVAVVGGHLVTEFGVLRAGLAIKDGLITAIGDEDTLPQSEETIDAEGLMVLPGIIDPHLHLQDAYYKYEQLIETETRAAASGGVTSIIPMMFRRSDPNESFSTVFPYLMAGAEGAAHIDYGFTGLVTTDGQIDELSKYASEFGITSFKVMMAYKGPEAEVFGVRSVDDSQILRTLATLRDIGYPGMTMVHTENMELVYHFKERLIASGRNDLGAYDDARPYFAEEENLRRAIYFAEITDSPLYVVHMSIGTGVELVRAARERGVKVIAETCPHFLAFNRDDAPNGWMGKVNPPIRSAWHQEALWEAIRSGIIQCVGSDHSTLMPRENKMRDSLWDAMPGFPGTGELLPVMLSEGVNKRGLPIERVAEVASTNVAKAFGVYGRKGTLRIGSDGDLTIVDLNLRRTVDSAGHQSIAGYNLYEGVEFTGWPVMAVVRGTVVMRDGEIVGPAGHGRYLPRQLNAGTWEETGLFPAVSTSPGRRLPAPLPVM